MLLAEWLTPRVELSIGGRAWPLIFTHRALLLCERTTGIDSLSANLVNPSAALMRGLLFAALSTAGSNVSVAEIGKHLTLRRLPSIRSTLIAAWIGSMPDPERAIKRVGDDDSGPEEPMTWLRVWAEAVSRDGLGLTEQQWLDMTPRQMQELQILRYEQIQREELLMGILAATIENSSMHPPKRPASAETFMLHKFPPLPIGDHIMLSMRRMRG